MIAAAITPAIVRAGIERELRDLASFSLSDAEALARAIVTTAAKIANSAVLVEQQAHDGLCHACGEALDDARPVVAVIQGKGGGHLWLHAGECHDVHRARRARLVEDIMATAGYGASRHGEAA